MNAPSFSTIPYTRLGNLLTLLGAFVIATGCDKAPPPTERPKPPPPPTTKPNAQKPPTDALTHMPCLDYSIEAVRRPITKLPVDGMTTITGISYSEGKPLDRATVFATDLDSERQDPDPDSHHEVRAFADEHGGFTLKVPTNRRIMVHIYDATALQCAIKFRSDKRFDMHLRANLEPRKSPQGDGNHL